jgi:pimeloyl-ACP methyl ester carboxylesterase
VSALLSIEGGPAESLTTASFRRAMRFAPLLRVLGGMPLLRRTVRNGLVDASGNRAWVTDAVVTGYIAGPAQNLKLAYRALGDMAKARESGPVAPRLGEVKVPVILMVGNAPHHAGSVDPGELKLLGRTVRAFALDTVAGAGHFIQEEQPATVIAAMERLLGMVAPVD